MDAVGAVANARQVLDETLDSSIERLLADVRGHITLDGTSELMNAIISKDLGL